MSSHDSFSAQRNRPELTESVLVPLVNQFSLMQQQMFDQFQQMAVTGLPRIDIIEAYPNWPGIHTSVPGFQTGFLASRFSNGPHTIYMRAYVNGAGSSGGKPRARMATSRRAAPPRRQHREERLFDIAGADLVSMKGEVVPSLFPGQGIGRLVQQLQPIVPRAELG